jgi:hypothetical protein
MDTFRSILVVCLPACLLVLGTASLNHAADDIAVHRLSCSIVVDKFSIPYVEASGSVLNLTNRDMRHIQFEVTVERAIHREPKPRVLTAIMEPVISQSAQTFHVVGSAPYDWQDYERCDVSFRLYGGRDLIANGQTEVRLALPTVSSR